MKLLGQRWMFEGKEIGTFGEWTEIVLDRYHSHKWTGPSNSSEAYCTACGIKYKEFIEPGNILYCNETIIKEIIE